MKKFIGFWSRDRIQEIEIPIFQEIETITKLLGRSKLLRLFLRLLDFRSHEKQ
jgi:hypothetical protein